MGEAERGETAPRIWISFYCCNGHETKPSFASEAQIPDTWDCPRCGFRNPPEYAHDGTCRTCNCSGPLYRQRHNIPLPLQPIISPPNRPQDARTWCGVPLPPEPGEKAVAPIVAPRPSWDSPPPRRVKRRRGT